MFIFLGVDLQQTAHSRRYPVQAQKDRKDVRQDLCDYPGAILSRFISSADNTKPAVSRQAVLAGINLNDAEYKNGDNQPSLEALSIFRHVDRVTRGRSSHPTLCRYSPSPSRSHDGGCAGEEVGRADQTRDGAVRPLIYCRTVY